MSATNLAGDHRPDEPTPDEVRKLASSAEQLTAAIRELRSRLRAAADEPTQQSGVRLDDAAGWTASVAKDLADTADDLARIQSRSDCAADWGVCPHHGNTLRSTGGQAVCTAPGCGLEWVYDRLALPCTEPATNCVTDAEGSTTVLCDGHTLDAGERLIGAGVQPLPAGRVPDHR